MSKHPLYDAHIMPKDLLTITVNTSDPDAAIPFNLTVATPITANSKNLTSQPSLQQYLVDNNGNIDFPVLGTLHIGGLTKSQAENMIKEKLKTYIKEDSYCKCTHGKLQNLCDGRSCQPRYIHHHQ